MKGPQWVAGLGGAYFIPPLAYIEASSDESLYYLFDFLFTGVTLFNYQNLKNLLSGELILPFTSLL